MLKVLSLIDNSYTNWVNFRFSNLLNKLLFQLTEIEAEELEAGIKTMEIKRQISYQTITRREKKVRNIVDNLISRQNTLWKGHSLVTEFLSTPGCMYCNNIWRFLYNLFLLNSSS